MARFIHAQERAPRKAKRFAARKRVGQEHFGGRIKYKESTRHYVEVEHYSYRRRLERAAAELAV